MKADNGGLAAVVVLLLLSRGLSLLDFINAVKPPKQHHISALLRCKQVHEQG